jgi:hypothetical protein
MNMSGFEYINKQLTIEKDTTAQLLYTLDWTEWLAGDTIASVEHTIQARVNDPKPLLMISDGIVDNKTYIELAEGQISKSYTVTAKITTTSGYIDRRNFKVNVGNRSA